MLRNNGLCLCSMRNVLLLLVLAVNSDWFQILLELHALTLATVLMRSWPWLLQFHIHLAERVSCWKRWKLRAWEAGNEAILAHGHNSAAVKSTGSPSQGPKIPRDFSYSSDLLHNIKCTLADYLTKEHDRNSIILFLDIMKKNVGYVKRSRQKFEL